MSPLLVNLCAGGIIFAILMARDARARRAQPAPAAGKTTRVAASALAAVNLAGALGLAWFGTTMLIDDGVMVVELGIVAGLIAVLLLATIGALALRRRDRMAAAIVLLAVAALPTLATYSFLLYLDANPIDMR